MIASGEVDVGTSFAGTVVYHLDAGLPLTALAGLHAGCYELFAREPIRSISDLKGRRVGIQTLSSSGHLYLSIMATYVGLDPQRDIEWVSAARRQRHGAVRRRRHGRVPRVSARAAGAARARLRPGDPEHDQRPAVVAVLLLHDPRRIATWVRDHPVATKRFLRAVFKAAEFCKADPQDAARRLVDAGFTAKYDYALQTIRELPYELWHEYDSEDTLRFYALRLHEAGMITAARTRCSPRAPTGASSTS